MKKVLFFVVAVLAISYVNAQEISYGLKAGLNYSNLRFSDGDMDSFDPRLSFHVGGVAEIAFSDKFSIQPELLYSSLGSTIDVSGLALRSSDEKYVYQFDYLTLPVMAKYYVAEGFSLEAGPQLGLLLSAKAKYDGESADMKDNFNSIDFAVGLGAGYKMENGISFGVRYALGLSNIAKDSGDEWVKNNVFQFSVGYKFN